MQSEYFSAHDTATSTIRYRKNDKTGKLESNAVYSRWSDGSGTITIGDTTYELTSKPLAPWGQKVYQDVLDSHQYLAAPYVSAQMMQLVGHFTNQYTVVPNSQLQDVAIQKLKASMQNKARESGKNEKGSGIAVIEATEDPELAKKQAEQAEKERMKLQRRRETASARAEQQTGRVRGAIGGGLSLDDLEGRSRNLSGKKKRAPGGPRQPRRRAEYDSDDDLPHGRTREDEYDMDDGFLAPSDEEQEVGSEDSEEELEEESERESRRRKKQKTRREEPGSDVDAEGEDEDDMAPQSSAAPASTDASGARGRKRHIIEDDEDDE
jgi:RNA polymerase-associated protein LEO1